MLWARWGCVVDCIWHRRPGKFVRVLVHRTRVADQKPGPRTLRTQGREARAPAWVGEWQRAGKE